MNPARSVAILFCTSLIAACGGGSSGGGSASPTAPSSTSTPSTATPATSTTPGALPASPYTWTPEGVRLDGAALGFTGAFADSTTIRLNDGRYRMYVFASGQYRSAISADGLNFTMEEGTRMPTGYGHMRVVRAPDGRIRAYNITDNGIGSAVSSDEGVTFTIESGMRITEAAAGFVPSGASIVQMPNGLWRMYFSSLPRPGEGLKVHPTKSAFSSDMLNWTMDAGVRIGTGATLSESAEHPGALVNPDGSVSLFYFRNNTLKFLMSTASDGLTFTQEFDTGISQANDPDLVRLSDNSVRLYYNWAEGATTGTVSSALYSGTPFTATSMAPVAPLRPAGAGDARPFWQRFGFTPSGR